MANGVLATWKQKRAFDLLADLEHMFGAEALERGSDLLNKAGQRIWETCDITASCTVRNIISQYCEYDSDYYYEIRNYPNRMGGKFK